MEHRHILSGTFGSTEENLEKNQKISKEVYDKLLKEHEALKKSYQELLDSHNRM